MSIRNLLLTAAGTALALSMSAQVSAVTIDQGLVNGLNTIVDEDREAFIDADESGTFSIGDVFVGYVQFSDFTNPGGGSTADDQVYGVISNQIVGVADNGDIQLGVTGSVAGVTVTGLTLTDLIGGATGDATVDAALADGMFAIYDSPVSYQNLIIDPIGSDIFDNTEYIAANGTLRLVTGVDTSTDDFFNVDAIFPLGTPTGAFIGLLDTVPVGSYNGALSIWYNNTNFTFNDRTGFNVDTLAFVDAPIIVNDGSIGGYAGSTAEPGVFTSAPGFDQCTGIELPVNVACGFTTKANFFVDVERVPEPASLYLFGAALLSLGFARRRFSVA